MRSSSVGKSKGERPEDDDADSHSGKQIPDCTKHVNYPKVMRVLKHLLEVDKEVSSLLGCRRFVHVNEFGQLPEETSSSESESISWSSLSESEDDDRYPIRESIRLHLGAHIRFLMTMNESLCQNALEAKKVHPQSSPLSIGITSNVLGEERVFPDEYPFIDANEFIDSSIESPTKRRKFGPRHQQQLVLCYAQLPSIREEREDKFPACYKFHSFSIDQLICPSSTVQQLKPQEKFEWLGPKRAHHRFSSLPFINFLKVQQQGRNFVYAVGGWIDTATVQIPIPRRLYRISLTTPLHESRVKKKKSMSLPKNYPLMAEIGGLIYVLSRPCPFDPRSCNKPFFEVYNPSKHEWTVLPPPPFLTATKDYKLYYSVKDEFFPYLVIRGKLIVSCGIYSSTFDPESREWGVCELFSNILPGYLKNNYDYKPLPGCGHPFPFLHRPILLCQETILLCVDAIVDDRGRARKQFRELDCYKSQPSLYTQHCWLWEFIPPISAYLITDENTPVRKIPLLLDKLPYGEFSDLVDLGGDHFAVLLYKKEVSDRCFETSSKCVTIATFKLEFERAGNGSLLLVGRLKSLSDCERVEGVLSRNVRHAFTM